MKVALSKNEWMKVGLKSGWIQQNPSSFRKLDSMKKKSNSPGSYIIKATIGKKTFYVPSIGVTPNPLTSKIEEAGRFGAKEAYAIKENLPLSGYTIEIVPYGEELGFLGEIS